MQLEVVAEIIAIIKTQTADIMGRKDHKKGIMNTQIIKSIRINNNYKIL